MNEPSCYTTVVNFAKLGQTCLVKRSLVKDDALNNERLTQVKCTRANLLKQGIPWYILFSKKKVVGDDDQSEDFTDYISFCIAFLQHVP